MKTYKLLLGLTMPFWSFAAENNLTDTIASANPAKLKPKNINDEEKLIEYLKYGKSRNFDKTIEIVKNLMSFNITSINDFPLLYIACGCGDIEVVKYLVSFNVDTNFIFNGAKPLHMACHHGHLEIVKFLILHNTNINTLSDSNETPLHIACHQGYLKIVKHLISHNANINALNNQGATPLDIACDMGHIDIVKCLLSKDLMLLSKESIQPNVYPLTLIKKVKHIEELLYFIEKENLKAAVKLELTPEYLGAWYVNGSVGLRLLQQGIFHPYDHKVFKAFAEPLGLKTNNEININNDLVSFNGKITKLVSGLTPQEALRITTLEQKKFFYKGNLIRRFNFTKKKVRELIVDCNWKEITKIQNPLLKNKQKNKLLKPFISIFFSPCQIFKLIQDQYTLMLYQYKVISSIKEPLYSFKYLSSQERYDKANDIIKKNRIASESNYTINKNIWAELNADRLLEIIDKHNKRNILEMNISNEMKQLIKIVSKEYNLVTVTNEYGLNLLHIFASNIDICDLIAYINPNLILMKNNNGDIPFLGEFYKNILTRLMEIEIDKEISSLMEIEAD